MDRRHIQLSVADVTPQGIFLNASDYLTYETIEVGLTVDEAYAREDWLIVSNYWPIDRDIPPTTFANPCLYTDRLANLQREVGKLREEQHSTCDHDRYEMLSSANGPIRGLERRIDTYKMLVNVAFHAVFGFWPNRFREHLGI